MSLLGFIKRLLLTMLWLPFILLPVVYFSLQTQAGSQWFSNWLSEYSGYHISIGQINHTLSNANQIEIEQLTITQQQKKLIDVKKALLQIEFNKIGTPHFLESLQLEQGSVYIDDPGQLNSVATNTLKLMQIDMSVMTKLGTLELQQVNAGISPWKIEKLLEQNSTFQLSVEKLALDQAKGEHLLLLGRTSQGKLIIDSFGVNLPYGEITAKGQRYQDGSWLIENLAINHLNMQLADSLQTTYARLYQLPDLSIKQISILNSNIEGNQWAINNGHLSLRELNWKDKQWTAQEGQVSFSADNVVYQGIQLDNIITELELQYPRINIAQFNGRWQGGLVSTNGNWQPNTLTLNELVISSVEYVVPDGAYQLPSYSFPSWLKNLSIEDLQLRHSVIVNINPEFPWQFTLLNIYGENLQFIKDHRLGIWKGNATLMANNATLNSLDMRYPIVQVTANDEFVYTNKLNTFMDDGIIEGVFNAKQGDYSNFTLSLTGQNVPVNALTHFGWQPIPMQGKGNIELQLVKKAQNTLTEGIYTATNEQGARIIQHYPAQHVESKQITHQESTITEALAQATTPGQQPEQQVGSHSPEILAE